MAAGEELEPTEGVVDAPKQGGEGRGEIEDERVKLR